MHGFGYSGQRLEQTCQDVADAQAIAADVFLKVCKLWGHFMLTRAIFIKWVNGSQ